MKIIVIKHFNGILFYKFGPAKKQHMNHSSNLQEIDLYEGLGNIKMVLKNIGINMKNWLDSALGKEHWRALVNAPSNIRVL